MIRCIFIPIRDSEREARRRFPGYWAVLNWEPAFAPDSALIYPPGRADLARWVDTQRIGVFRVIAVVA